MNPHPTSRIPLWQSWLPSRGNVLFTLLVAVGLLFYTNNASATLARTQPTVASTATIPYQGRLADASGAPVNGAVAMTFNLYDIDSGGVALWTETWPAVQVNGGLFNVLLGSTFAITPSVFSDNDSLWLGVTVGGDSEMTPRVQLGSVPFAMQALTVSTIQSGAVDSGTGAGSTTREVHVVFNKPFTTTPNIVATSDDLAGINEKTFINVLGVTSTGFDIRWYKRDGSVFYVIDPTVKAYWIASGPDS